jgi:catalase
LFSPSSFQFDLLILLIALCYLLELIITKSFATLLSSTAMYSIFTSLCILHAAMAACPYMDSSHGSEEHSLVGAERVVPRDVPSTQSSQDFLDQFTLNDTNAILTSDVGGPIEDQFSLKAGERGPTLLEDFIFRQKIQHFDHERVS